MCVASLGVIDHNIRCPSEITQNYFFYRLVGSSRIERCDDVMMCDEVIDNDETRLSVEQSVRVRLNDDKKNRVCPTDVSMSVSWRVDDWCP